jgi:hypothetical protein
MVYLENNIALVICPMHLKFITTTTIFDDPITMMAISLSNKCVIAFESPWVLLIALLTRMGIFTSTPFALN